MELKISTGGIRVVGTQKYLMGEKKALVAKVIADTAPGVHSTLK